MMQNLVLRKRKGVAAHNVSQPVLGGERNMSDQSRYTHGPDVEGVVGVLWRMECVILPRESLRQVN